MPAYVPRLSAEEVDARLLGSLREQHAAESNAFLWFAEALNRRLYRTLGYSTAQQYALERLDFSRSKTAYFIRLGSVIRNLPRLHAAMARGEIGWSKAVLLVKVATRATEKQWIEEAQTCGRRELARKVKAAQRAASGGRGAVDLFTTVTETPAQASAPALGQAPRVAVGAQAEAQAPARAESLDPALEQASALAPAKPSSGVPIQESLPAAATEVRLRLAPAQRGQYEALLERARKLGAKGDNPELVLEALTRLVLDLAEAARGDRREQDGPRKDPSSSNRLDAESAENGLQSHVLSGDLRTGASPRTHLPVYQVYVRTCEECGRGWMETNAGPRLLEVATLRSILCDARVSRPGEPNRHCIPPKLRRQALERDRYRCRAGGCGSHRSLNVHHLHAREDGGKHTLDNLITLCSPCHTLVHALRGDTTVLRARPGKRVPAPGSSRLSAVAARCQVP